MIDGEKVPDAVPAEKKAIGEVRKRDLGCAWKRH
jgi:hypothetical protein